MGRGGGSRNWIDRGAGGGTTDFLVKPLLKLTRNRPWKLGKEQKGKQ